MKLVILLIIGCAFNDVVRSDSMWDEIIDQAIDAAKDDIIDHHADVIHIDKGIEKEFHESIFNIPYTILLKVHGLEIWNTSSLSRKNDVLVIQDDTAGNITFATALGLDDFGIRINQFNVHVFGLNVAGSVDARCKTNALDFSISLITDKDNNCHAALNWARIIKLNDFNVEVVPSGITNWLAEHLSNFILNEFSSHVIKIINDYLAIEMNHLLDGIDICKYSPL